MKGNITQQKFCSVHYKTAALKVNTMHEKKLCYILWSVFGNNELLKSCPHVSDFQYSTKNGTEVEIDTSSLKE